MNLIHTRFPLSWEGNCSISELLANYIELLRSYFTKTTLQFHFICLAWIHSDMKRIHWRMRIDCSNSKMKRFHSNNDSVSFAMIIFLYKNDSVAHCFYPKINVFVLECYRFRSITIQLYLRLHTFTLRVTLSTFKLNLEYFMSVLVDG